MNIIFTMGDPNGIGIEIMLKALSQLIDEKEYAGKINISLTANTETLKNYTDAIGFQLDISDGIINLKGKQIKIIECDSYSKINFGMVTREAGLLAAESIEKALDSTLSGCNDAMVTMPVNKEALYLAGWKYPGHTEMLTDRCGKRRAIMILCTKTVRVALQSIHTPIRDLPFEISAASITNKCTVFHHSVRDDFGIPDPTIAILGLNPHAGEHGTIGREEEDIILPAMQKLRARSINVQGPFPADGFFAFGEYKKYDGIYAMYHDQGLIPLKLLADGGGVNVTAGLQIVRTSPDHGTAFPLAGKNIANPKSAYEAIEMAIEIAHNRKKAINNSYS